MKLLLDEAFAARVLELRAHGAREPADVPELTAPQPVSPSAPTEVPSPPARRLKDYSAALQFLAVLQREGRLVDFLQQDIHAFDDADVGAAARVVHEGARRALRRHIEITPICSEGEGNPVTLGSGFDPDAIKLTGNVTGAPPYHGTLRHSGWRVTRMELPQPIGNHDDAIIAPAEVEL